MYYELTVPFFNKKLESLSSILKKGWEHAQKNDFTERTYLEDSLAPDMFSLKRQVQLATDNAKGAVARLAGSEILIIEDNEETVEELTARIDVVRAHLSLYSPEQFDKAETTQIRLPYFPDRYLKGKDYLCDYAIPNFLFHVVTAYDIIRHQGAPLGKSDYLGTLPFHSLPN